MGIIVAAAVMQTTVTPRLGAAARVAWNAAREAPKGRRAGHIVPHLATFICSPFHKVNVHSMAADERKAQAAPFTEPVLISRKYNPALAPIVTSTILATEFCCPRATSASPTVRLAANSGRAQI